MYYSLAAENNLFHYKGAREGAKEGTVMIHKEADRLARVVRFPQTRKSSAGEYFWGEGIDAMLTKFRGKFGKRLQALCEIADIDKKSLANCLGVTVRQVENYLSGNQFPTGIGMVKLHLLFGVPMGVIYGTEPMERQIDKQEVHERLRKMI